MSFALRSTLTFCLLTAIACGWSRPVAAQPGNQPTGPRPGATRPQVPPRAQPPASPFRLNARQQAFLDHVLKRWEQRSAKIQTMSATFTLFERDSVFNKVTQHSGEVKYKAPDKGLYQVKGDRATKFQGEYWVCDGRSIFEFDYANKRLKERKLPPHLQGKAISAGPLPFLFSQTAEKLKHRYHMRIITPPNSPGQVWIETLPRFQSDAANFEKVEVILKDFNQQLHLYALQVHLPGGNNRKSYVFPDPDPSQRRSGEKLEVNKLNLLDRWFFKPRTPLGWKYEVVQEIPRQAAKNPPRKK